MVRLVAIIQRIVSGPGRSNFLIVGLDTVMIVFVITLRYWSD